MRDPDNGNLIVVASSTVEVRLRIKIEQRLCLRSNLIAGYDKSGRTLRKITIALCGCRHLCGLHGGVSILRPAVADVEHAVPEQIWNLQWSAKRDAALKTVVGGLRRVLSGERKRS